MPPPPPEDRPRSAARSAGRTASAVRPAGPAPSEAALRDAALAHLARFAATEAGLTRVLDRRVDRWVRRAERDGMPGEDAAVAAAVSRALARAVASALAGAGAVDDRAFAEARGRSLARAGRSRRATLAHLAAKGVPKELAQAVLPEPEMELGSALAYARRRRMGPFRIVPMPEDATEASDLRRRELASLARAGFPAETASQALRMAPDEAEALVARLRQA